MLVTEKATSTMNVTANTADNNTSSIEQARFNMVEQQIRTWEVLDQSVLDLLFVVKREEFVPEGYRALAFMDVEIPLGNDAPGQFMMSPKMEARIIQEVAPKPHERVLEVGTGSGYLTALLATQSARVATIEIVERLANQAAGKLARAGIPNVEVAIGDAAITPAAFIPAGQLFEVIVLTGSTPVLPEAYLDYLAPGGRLFAIVGDAPVMQATIVNKAVGGATTHTSLFETVVAPLINARAPSRFRF
jgi:protein-L-isoaspartate(D-aspartate) O-methyltransferase